MAGKMDDDEPLLVPGSEAPLPPVLQQPYVDEPSGATPPPTYYPSHPPAVPLTAFAGGPSGGSFSQQSHHTTVVINQPTPVVRGPRDWSSPMCSCCDDMGSCLLGFFCPCVLACNIAQDMDESCCVPCCVPCWLIVLRAKLRAENNIVGSVMDDCCVTLCCGACVMCQMARELKFLRMTQRQPQ